ncbi:Probable chromosome-partitioning protein parB [Urinicoccus massiliensis]|uniref:Probable chromosome-partitioning protein parB n=1 Tax=Urinicoccus massiliensis TaxID=1723382 RepID=A0A8H2QZ29_9FIRM|nr:ParB/RepB/Spo0J family partition protein [Urinicoccus massiliensis]VFB17354.1 Probable chromosome-partitioning protein parB [Urinicoccus massiliensis]
MSMGRGLDSFFKDAKEVKDILETKDQETNQVSLKEIFPNKNQPRKVFDQEELEGLAASIKEHGVLQPLILRKTQDGYQIIAGERRYRAAKLAGLDKVPVLVKDISDQQADAISLIENLQREDLNPIEEAQALKAMMETHKLTQQDLADLIGKNRSSIANLLRLLNLEKEVQGYLAQGDLTFSHGKLLLKIKDPKKQVAKARDIIKKGQTILETEENLDNKKPKSQEEKDIFIRDVEEQLTRCLGTKVRLKTQGRVKKIQIDYYNNDDLERIMEQMMGEGHEGL